MSDTRYQQAGKLIAENIQAAEQSIGLEALSADFFQRFFTQYPETQDYFSETDIGSFAPKKFRYVSEFMIDIYSHPNYAEGNLAEEVIRHQIYGLSDKEYYFSIMDALHASVKAALGKNWNHQNEEAWLDATAALRSTIANAVTDLL